MFCSPMHSHNDYEQETPFWTAYQNYAGSIEADIWAINGELYVAHNKRDIKKEKTLDAMYLQPIANIFKQNKGRAFKDCKKTFQLMIDLKDTPYVLLNLLVKKLAPYKNIFDKKINPNAVTIVISASDTILNYPDFIHFDGKIGKIYSPEQLQKIKMMSEDFANFSSWNGEEKMSRRETTKLKNIIGKIHLIGKKARFWNTGDNEIIWEQLLNLGVDFISTDKPEQFAAFYKKYSSKKR